MPKTYLKQTIPMKLPSMQLDRANSIELEAQKAIIDLEVMLNNGESNKAALYWLFLSDEVKAEINKQQ